MKALALTAATDEESALLNRADDKPTSSGPLEKVDELAGLMGGMGGMDMTLNFLANQSGDPQFLDTCGDLFLERFQGTGKEVDIDNAISAYELAFGMMSTDHEKYGAYTGDAGVALLKIFQTLGNIHNINRAASLLEISVSFIPGSNANLMGRLNDLGFSL